MDPRHGKSEFSSGHMAQMQPQLDVRRKSSLAETLQLSSMCAPNIIPFMKHLSMVQHLR